MLRWTGRGKNAGNNLIERPLVELDQTYGVYGPLAFTSLTTINTNNILPLGKN